MRYSANAYKNSNVSLKTLNASLEVTQIYANGTTIINSSITVSNVVSLAQTNVVTASGTIGIGEDELIMLLAA